MLTGRRPFPGEAFTDTVAGILQGTPDWSRLPATVHPKVRELLERCLAKDVKYRWRDIADVGVDLERVLTDPSGIRVESVASARSSKSLLPWVVATLFVTAVIVSVASWNLIREPPSDRRIEGRFSHVLPDGQAFGQSGRPLVAVSPDGTKIVYVASGQLYLRNLSNLESGPIAGTTERPNTPFFSPDGQWLGYFSGTDGQLKKIEVSGGVPVTLCDAANPYGASWGADDSIVYGQLDGIMRVSANAGTPALLIKTEEQEQVHGPQILPDGKSLLFTLANSRNLTRWDEAQVVVQSLESGERTTVLTGASDARYVPTGHLVYVLDDDLFAVPFELSSLEVTGGAVPIEEGLARVPVPSGQTGTGHFGFSNHGSLAYVAAASDLQQGTLVWVDRQGRATPVTEQQTIYSFPRISPDGRRVAVEITEGGNEDIWVIDLDRGTRTRLTLEPGRDIQPLWTRDGTRVTFSSNRAGSRSALYWTLADGGGTAELLVEVETNLGATSWSPDGQTLLFYETWAPGLMPPRLRDILAVSPGGAPTPILATPFTEYGATFSPDGRWIAYASRESGIDEVYVRPYSGPGSKMTISTEGGRSPLWSAYGTELF